MLEFTAVFRRVPEGYIGYVEELPGANSQGTTLDETRENLREAIQLIVDANREMAAEAFGPEGIVRERIAVG
jgi:predicted RNase H-like HicB family nuclease